MHCKIKTVETLQICEKKSGRIPPTARKRSCKIKMTSGYTEGFVNFRNKQQVYEVIFFDM